MSVSTTSTIAGIPATGMAATTAPLFLSTVMSPQSAGTPETNREKGEKQPKRPKLQNYKKYIHGQNVAMNVAKFNAEVCQC